MDGKAKIMLLEQENSTLKNENNRLIEENTKLKSEKNMLSQQTQCVAGVAGAAAIQTIVQQQYIQSLEKDQRMLLTSQLHETKLAELQEENKKLLQQNQQLKQEKCRNEAPDY